MTLMRIISRIGSTGGSMKTVPFIARFAGVIAVLAVPTALLLTSPKTHAQDNGSSAGTKVTVPMAVHWKYTGNYFGSNPAAPVLTKDTAFFASGNRVYAVNLDNGTLKWRYPSVTEPLQSLVTVTPAISDDTLYVGAGDGLYAFTAADGKLKWHYNVQGGVDTTPVVQGEAVYFVSGGARIHAVNISTGETLGGIWKQGRYVGLDSGGDIATDTTVANGLLIYATGNEIIHAIDMTSGIQKWTIRPGSIDRSSMPIVTGESLTLVNGPILSSWRVANGQFRWRVQLPNGAAVPPVVDGDGNIFVITDLRQVLAMNTRGRYIWPQTPILDYFPIASPVLTDDLLIVATSKGGIYAYDKTTGALKWNYSVLPSATSAGKIPNDVNIGARPVVAGNTLYVLSDDGALTAFRHDAPDSLPPVISHLEPDQGDALNGRPPFFISAKILDEGSGINISTLKMKLDEETIPRRSLNSDITDKNSFTYDPDSGKIEYSSVDISGKTSTLKNGYHSVTVSVKDWMGNQLNKNWSFLIDDTIPRRARKGTTPAGTGTGTKGGGGGGVAPKGSGGGGATGG